MLSEAHCVPGTRVGVGGGRLYQFDSLHPRGGGGGGGHALLVPGIAGGGAAERVDHWRGGGCFRQIGRPPIPGKDSLAHSNFKLVNHPLSSGRLFDFGWPVTAAIVSLELENCHAGLANPPPPALPLTVDPSWAVQGPRATQVPKHRRKFATSNDGGGDVLLRVPPPPPLFAPPLKMDICNRGWLHPPSSLSLSHRA